MKFLLVAFLFVAVANAGLVVPSVYSAYSSPLAYSAYSAPLAYSAPVAYAAPLAYAAPAIQPGYVAATRGSLHTAPLPGNTPLASHHLNLAPAPGTF